MDLCRLQPSSRSQSPPRKLRGKSHACASWWSSASWWLGFHMQASAHGSSWTRELPSVLWQQLCAPSLPRAQLCTTLSSTCWWINRLAHLKNHSNLQAHSQAKLYIKVSFAFFFSSVTACWAQLEWEARWMMRPQCLPARQRCLLCLKCRDISLLPGHFPFYWLFDLEQSWMLDEWSSGMCELPSEQLHQERNQWTAFSNLLFERCHGKCLRNLSCEFKILKNNAKISKHIHTSSVCGCSLWLPMLSAQSHLMTDFILKKKENTGVNATVFYFFSYIGGNTFCTNEQLYTM